MPNKSRDLDYYEDFILRSRRVSNYLFYACVNFDFFLSLSGKTFDPQYDRTKDLILFFENHLNRQSYKPEGSTYFTIQMQNNKITFSKETPPSCILHQLPLTKGDPSRKKKILLSQQKVIQWDFASIAPQSVVMTNV